MSSAFLANLNSDGPPILFWTYSPALFRCCSELLAILSEIDIIYNELSQNNVEIDEDTPSFHIQICLGENEEYINTLLGRVDPLYLHCVYEDMTVNNFCRMIAYLAFMYWLKDSYDEKTLRKALRWTTLTRSTFVDANKFKIFDCSF